MKKIKEYFKKIKEFFSEFMAADPFTYSSSIAFYTLFSMPAILFLVVQLAGLFYGQEAVSGRLSEQIDGLVGHDTAETIEGLLKQVDREDKSIWTTLLSFGAVIVGSTTVFGSIQTGLNQIWKVRPKESAGWFKLLLDRLFSFTIVIALGFLMIVSFVVDALLAYFSDYLLTSFPDITVIIAKGINILLSLAVISSLFAMVLKLLPDVKISWKQAWVGGFATTVLFYIGKYLIGIYLSTSDLGTSYGAAGSLVLLLVWVYYSSLILLLGGKITQAYVAFTDKIRPTKLAVRFETKEIVLTQGKEENDEKEI